MTHLGLRLRRAAVGVVAGCVGFGVATSAGCGSSGSGASAAVDGPVIRYPSRSGSDDGMAALVSGELVYDGGCLYLVQEASGVRYPILWPAGTRWDATGPAVRPPVGQALSMRSRVSGGGGYLQLDQVRRLAGPQAADVANKCLDNTDGEVAVVNNADNAITLAP